jgi:hypothetical protein
VHPEKALLPIFVTELGIMIFVRPVQPENAFWPIEVTSLPNMTSLILGRSSNHDPISLAWIIILVKFGQSLNVSRLMSVTEQGMVMLVRLEQPWNAWPPIEVVELPMTTLVNLEQL